MTYCDPTKYASKTIFWDNSNFKAYYPEDIIYSVQTQNITGKKITWDSQEYIIQNINNYSYSVELSFICANYQLWVNNIRRYPGNSSGNAITKPVSWGFRHRSQGVPAGSPTPWYYIYWNEFFCRYHGNLFCAPTPINEAVWQIDGYFSVPTPRTYPYYFLKANGSPVDKVLRIIDGNVTSEYPIINENSINVVDYPIGTVKKLIINGNEFALIDENSIEILCTDPLPQCPENTIECDCGNGVIWCLVEIPNKGYQVVSCINY